MSMLPGLMIMLDKESLYTEDEFYSGMKNLIFREEFYERIKNMIKDLDRLKNLIYV